MGLRDLFTGSKRSIEIQGFTNSPSSAVGTDYGYGDWLDSAFAYVDNMSPAELWRTQPYLRLVVNFLARNIAQLGLQTFQRVSETDRVRLRDDPMAKLLAQPNQYQTAYELVFGTVADLALYDTAFWDVGAADSPSGWSVQPIPPAWVTRFVGGDWFHAEGVEVTTPNGRRAEITGDRLFQFHGWNPANPRTGSSPIHALRSILKEQISAWAYRQQVWDRGGRVGAVLKRPATAPKWENEDRERFAASWRARYTGNDGEKAGGTPILEDGMELERVGFSAREDDWINAAKLSLATVAGVYHVNPTMVGVLDNANYSNVREFRRMLYGDTLGPTMAQIEDRLNTFLVPRVGDAPGRYVEFNIAEKLQGSFEEQASALSTLVGAPVMARNEGRSRLNLPAMDGGDELITPLNVLVGGQASPTDSAPPPKGELRAVRLAKEGT